MTAAGERARDTVRAALSTMEWRTLGEITARTGMSRDAAYRHVQRLVDEGAAQRRRNTLGYQTGVTYMYRLVDTHAAPSLASLASRWPNRSNTQ